MKSQANSLLNFPGHRPRRMRRDDWSRRLMQENTISANDLIYPVFLLEGKGKSEAVASMPGINRVSLDLLLNVAQECVDLGIPVLALFPVIDAALKAPDGREAFNPQGLNPNAVRELKKRFPNLGIMTDVALDPYTSHGQDGILDDQNRILNDETSAILVQQALTQAEAGVDIIAPSDMMDGRIRKIREALEQKKLIHTRIMAYSEMQWVQPRTSVKQIKKLIKWIVLIATKLCGRLLLISVRAQIWLWLSLACHI